MKVRTTHIRTHLIKQLFTNITATMRPKRRTQGKKIIVASKHDGITTSSRKKGKRGKFKDPSGRKSINIEVKLEIYEKKKGGAKNRDLAIEYGLAKSTISTIYNKQQVQKLKVAKSQMLSPKLLCIQNTRPAIQSDLEDILLEWMTLKLSRRIPMNQKMVQAKALAIFQYLIDPVNKVFDLAGRRVNLGEKNKTFHVQHALGQAYVDDSDPDDPGEVPLGDVSPPHVEENLLADYDGFSDSGIFESLSSDRAKFLFEASQIMLQAQRMLQDNQGDRDSDTSTEQFCDDFSDDENECERAIFGNQCDKALKSQTRAMPWRMEESVGSPPIAFPFHDDSMDSTINDPSNTQGVPIYNDESMDTDSDTPDTQDVQVSNDVSSDESEAGSSTQIKPYNFIASNGWYRNCVIKRFGFKRINLAGEAESADHEAAKDFIHVVTDFIIQYIKDPSKVYNIDEMGLYLKKMPTSALVKGDNKMRGFKPNKARCSVLVGGNMTGEKLKPLVIGKSANPRDFGKVDKATLPCYYESNKKSWMTTAIYWKWYLECFIPELEARHGPDFTVLLLVDNCTSHPEVVGTLDPRVIVMFLPPNTTSLIQPMDQGVIRNLKLRFHALFYDELIRHIDNTPITVTGTKPLVSFYKDVKMLRVIKGIGTAWNGVKDTTIQRSWSKLLDKDLLRPHEAFKEFAGPAPILTQANSDPVLEPAPQDDHEDDPEDDPEDENTIENNALLEEIVTNFNSCATLGPTLPKDISEVIDYNEIDLTTTELCQLVLEDKQTAKNAVHQHDKVSDNMGLTKNLQTILIAYANLQEAVIENIWDTTTTEVIMSHMEKGIKYVTDELAYRHEKYQQADIRKYFVIAKAADARESAKKISEQFSRKNV